MPWALFESEFLIIWRIYFLEKWQLANEFSVSKVSCDLYTLLSAKKQLKNSLLFFKNLLVFTCKCTCIPSRNFWAYEKGQSARIYRPKFIYKNDHVISWIKDLLSQASWLEKKKLVTFSLINFCLYQLKWFLNCEIYMDQTRRRH